MPERFETYEAFWPYYVNEHRDPVCRALHVAGTGTVFAFVGVAIAAGDPRWLLGCPLAGYAFAWLGHLLFEKNRPATFTYPLWSLRADFRMFFTILAGRMPAELERAAVSTDGGAPHAD
jgi:hypothetical protein